MVKVGLHAEIKTQDKFEARWSNSTVKSKYMAK